MKLCNFAARLFQRPRVQLGFTLLETLLALAILAVSLGVLTASFSMSANGALAARREMAVAAVAQSVLARVGTELPVHVGTVSGSAEEGLRWQVSIAPYDDPKVVQNVSVVPFKVSLEIQWEEEGKARSMTLKTLRLAPGR